MFSWDLELEALPREHLYSFSFGTFLTNYDVTTAHLRTAEVWLVLTYGTTGSNPGEGRVQNNKKIIKKK